jgi:FG-GAP repeat protein/type VI secretion system (T6SS) effector Hcp
MNTKILIAALAGLSVVAAAQSQTDKQKTKPSTTETQSSRDAASGQATGRLEQKNVVHRDLAARDVASGHATGKTMAHDDWQQTGAKPASSSDAKPSHVAVGDVNGDGRADVAVSSKNSAHATEAAASTSSSANVQAPRDVATGQASGKRQHQPLTITKSVDKATPRDAASGQASGKRQHQPLTIMKTTDKTSQ